MTMTVILWIFCFFLFMWMVPFALGLILIGASKNNKLEIKEKEYNRLAFEHNGLSMDFNKLHKQYKELYKFHKIHKEVNGYDNQVQNM